MDHTKEINSQLALTEQRAHFPCGGDLAELWQRMAMPLIIPER